MKEIEKNDNEYMQYRILCQLENIAEQYPQEKEYAEKLRALGQQIASRQYRVAVIGEFKRGKSSLINALLGAEILPTDILPLTAAVNRIVYGNEKGILIRYKDGHSQKAEIQELSAYTTKADEQAAQIAAGIQEIEVSYPSVFCQNHIELFDTPGLNDDDPMTETTLSVLQKIDAAIVVISAMQPYSITERNLVIKLLEHPEIRNILFVITFIDAVSSRREQQDRVITYIQNRIAKETLQQLEVIHGDDDLLMAKAKAILDTPTVLAVSATQAIKGFLMDDEELLEESRLPEFKYSLLEALTAGQSSDMLQKVQDAVKSVAGNIDGWYQARTAAIQAQLEEKQAAYQKGEAYIMYSRTALENILYATDRELEKIGFDMRLGLQTYEMGMMLRRIFISALGSIRADSVTRQEIEQTIERAAKEGLKQMERSVSALRQQVETALAQSSRKFGEARDAGLVTCLKTAWGIEAQDIRAAEGFPEFQWNGSFYSPDMDLLHAEIMPFITQRIALSLTGFRNACSVYLASWRKSLLELDGADRNLLRTIEQQGRLQMEQEQAALQMELSRVQYQQHKQQLQKLMESY